MMTAYLTVFYTSQKAIRSLISDKHKEVIEVAYGWMYVGCNQ